MSTFWCPEHDWGLKFDCIELFDYHDLWTQIKDVDVSAAAKSASKPVSDIYDNYFFSSMLWLLSKFKIPLHFFM